MSEHGESEEEARQRKLKRIWVGPLYVWMALMALIALTTWLGFMPLAHENVAANYGIAAIMVSLVAVFLMRLKEAKAVVWVAALMGLSFVFIMFLLTFGDYFNR